MERDRTRQSVQLATAGIYGVVVFIWGASFLMIEFQLGIVDEEVSVLYRYLAATLIILMYVAVAKKPMFSFPLRDHFLFALIGLFFFSSNYVFIYGAQKYLTSGVTAITFSMALFFTQINSRLFLGIPLRLKTTIGGVIGIAGLALIFRDAVFSSNFDSHMTKGMLLILTAAYIVSLATVVTAKITARGLPIVQSNAWAMIYGIVINCFLVILLGGKLALDPRVSYWVSFIYLVVFSSILGFLLYFVLVRRIGPEPSSYFVLMAPMIAIVMSVLVEGLELTPSLVLGTAAVLTGNLLTMRGGRRK